MTEPLIAVQHLAIAFPNNPVFKDLNFTINQGDFLTVIGENGVGKTTLIRALLGLVKPTSGSINYYPSKKATKIGYVPQFRNLDQEYPLTIEDFVGLNIRGWLPWLTKAEHRQVNTAMSVTNVKKIKQRPLGMASGGEKQRAYLAQAIVEEPQLLILDESTASLDNEMKYELLDLVQNLNQTSNITVLFITHDLPLAQKYADHFLALRPGQQEYGTMAGMSIEQLKEVSDV
ncbi:metal ABC transporter ATP-binding protein [Lactiplantibacillus mudanjiangensis]|uniref:Zinc/iron ABC transporter, ATP-binding protein [Lactobacillus plantarum JDM1] n=1 Tax=Lactiplantibacillus mudanjiangensis TaxID=1296538 RepID=A0A660E7G5_9LACO|nr:ABC transporter ATP-binding protein [Lactiplantibacillus mudanjiangensis]VDG21412.1 zinc/iron ABC transporter, ATP-binding protein [Lactobacillus plantarum JDM1] [Lactiplantibacillus mudanjiangensis]VDG26094.1 zinc/iron ABC transporter, ATP-binding protein [Lactobacillus plantarum JDM1] [Lactiplantibacillus mudanjiangensis]VDG29068.1 zinc/iron ABC transporter, ATP-binding protein [Lactobacillus plantarum JDM1] [Lactiplantibacillus mudanjiangensis]VDG31585.1 zinc/iron ABC transporter, ATP-bin